MPHEFYRTEKKVNHQIRELTRHVRLHVSVDWKVSQKELGRINWGKKKRWKLKKEGKRDRIQS